MHHLGRPCAVVFQSGRAFRSLAAASFQGLLQRRSCLKPSWLVATPTWVRPATTGTGVPAPAKQPTKAKGRQHTMADMPSSPKAQLTNEEQPMTEEATLADMPPGPKAQPKKEEQPLTGEATVADIPPSPKAQSKKEKQPVTEEAVRIKNDHKQKQQQQATAQDKLFRQLQKEDRQDKKLKQQQQGRKRPQSLDGILIRGIGEAARDGDLNKAMEVYRQAQAAGIRLPLTCYNTLLYLTVGGDLWEVLARGGDPDQAAEDNIRTATTGPAPALISDLAPVSLPTTGLRTKGTKTTPDGTLTASGLTSAAAEQAPGSGVLQGTQAAVETAALDTAGPLAKVLGGESQGSPMVVDSNGEEAGASAVKGAVTNGGALMDEGGDTVMVGADGDVQGGPVVAGDVERLVAGEALAAEAGEGPMVGEQLVAGAGEGSVASEPEAAAVLMMSREERVALANELWASMQQAGHKPDGSSYLALARLEGLGRQPDAALKWAVEAAEKRCAAMIRIYAPAMVGYCMHRNAAGLQHVEQLIAKQGATQVMDLTEYEFARLFEGLAADTRVPWETLKALLERMGREMEGLAPSTLRLIATYFSSPQSAAALTPTPQPAAEALADALPPPSTWSPAATPPASPTRSQPAPASATAAEASHAPLGLAASNGAVQAAASPTPSQPVAKSSAPAQPSQAHPASPGPATSQPGSPTPSQSAPQLPSHKHPRDTSDAPEAQVSQPAEVQEEPAKDTQPLKRQKLEADPQGTPQAPWHIQTVKVDRKGLCPEAGARLKVLDLEPEEWKVFADSVANLARSNEATSSSKHSPGAGNSFDSFIEWFDRHEPYDVMIDGANVAFFGQSYDGGGFNWNQIIQMVNMVRKRHPGRKILLMLHRNRTNHSSARTPRVQEFLAQLNAENAFYSTPHGSNDDWYWMYATIRMRNTGLLISNDELRDHIFSLLRPKHFLKWKARHIAQYTRDGWDGPFKLIYPPAYSTCIQQLENGVWMFPSAADDTWLCVRPSSLVL